MSYLYETKFAKPAQKVRHATEQFSAQRIISASTPSGVTMQRSVQGVLFLLIFLIPFFLFFFLFFSFFLICFSFFFFSYIFCVFFNILPLLFFLYSFLSLLSFLVSCLCLLSSLFVSNNAWLSSFNNFFYVVKLLNSGAAVSWSM